MEDRIETIGKGSVIQHGKLNDRIYLIKLGKEDMPWNPGVTSRNSQGE